MPRHDAADADIQMLPLFYAAWLPLPPLIRRLHLSSVAVSRRYFAAEDYYFRVSILLPFFFRTLSFPPLRCRRFSLLAFRAAAAFFRADIFADEFIFATDEDYADTDVFTSQIDAADYYRHFASPSSRYYADYITPLRQHRPRH
jgi:hypothetical protein